MTAQEKQNSVIKKSHVIILFAIIFTALPHLSFCAPAKVALLPVNVTAKENPEFLRKIVTDMLTSKLGRDPQTISLVNAADITGDAQTAAAVKRGAEYIVTTNLKVDEASLKLDAKIYHAANDSTTTFTSSAAGLDSVIALTDRLTEAIFSTIRKNSDATEGDSGAALIPKDAPVAWKSQPMDGAFLAMLYVDLDNDGAKEMVLMSKRNLVIARVKPDGLETIKQFKANLSTSYIALTAADSDNDGTRELYVSAVANKGASSMRIEFINSEYKITENGIRWMMRAFRSNRTARTASNPERLTLVGQKLRPDDGFYGKLELLKKSGPATVQAGPFMSDLPPEADIYRMELPDPTSSDEAFVLDQRGYFKAFGRNENNAWVPLFKSSDYYGGTLNLVEDEDPVPGNAPKDPIPVESAFYFIDLNRDGKNDIVIKRNVPGWLGRLSKFPRTFNEGAIISLSWDKFVQNYVEEWKTKPMAGYVADFFTETAQDGARIIYILVVTPDEKSYVLSRKMQL